MIRTLLLFAHPAIERSRVHRRLVQSLPPLEGLTFHDLYELYPRFDVDVAREQSLLTEHDLILVQHPFYWYSIPPLLKQWQDLVLEHGWAYGSKGTALRGKKIMHIVSTGGPRSAYDRKGHNRFSMRELMAPLEQTARLCGMEFLPPYVIHGTHRLTVPDIERECERYRRVVTDLCEGRLDLPPDRRDATLDDVLDAEGKESRP
jgi:glutathione-regulated potassium-efflux system ancillary protein KefG